MNRVKSWLTVLVCIGACLGILLSSVLPLWAAPPSSPPTPQPTPATAGAVNGRTLVLGMKDFGDADGFVLKTVKTERRYDFTRPTGWNVLPSSSIQLSFQHSPALLPERSSLNVLVNNRILKTIPLAKDNVLPNRLTIPIPPGILKDRNVLSFQVDQHYTYQCEDPFSPELWTTILPETTLNLIYAPKPFQPDLARFPYPWFDPLGYGATRIGYVAPPSLSDESLEALGVVAAGLGQRVGWRPLEPTVLDSVASDRNVVVIGTPGENPAVAALSASFPVPLEGSQFINPNTRSPLLKEEGVLLLVPNPGDASKAVLVVSGNSPQGVRNAAKVLMQSPSNQLLTGGYAIIREQAPGPQHPFRAWQGFLAASQDTFNALGMETLSARGITALPIFYKLKLMPDLFLPGKTKVKLKTVYSYSSQLEASQSKLEVLLNGKPLKSVALNDPKGQSLAETVVEIPSEQVHTYNDLVYQFHLYPEKYDLCRFVTDVHIWGTVHSTSSIAVPGEIKTPLPDLGLLNDGGFPFTIYQDLSQATAVLPKEPSSAEISTLVHLVTRLGRLSLSQTGINLTVAHDASLSDSLKKANHLIVIGQADKNALFKDIKGKLHLLVEDKLQTLSDVEQKKFATLNYTPSQGILEEVLSPWNEGRVALLVSGQTEEAFRQLDALFQDDQRFGEIQQGNLLVTGNGEAPKTLLTLQRGEARFLFPVDMWNGYSLPLWAWVTLGILALLGLLSLFRFGFGK